MTVYGLIMLVVMLVMFYALHPILQLVVAGLLANSTDATVSIVVNLYIPIISLMILVTIVSMGSYLRQRQ